MFGSAVPRLNDCHKKEYFRQLTLADIVWILYWWLALV